DTGASAGGGSRPRAPATAGAAARRRRLGLGQLHYLTQLRVRLGRVRNAHRRYEVRLALRLDRGLDLFHAPHQLFDSPARVAVEQLDARTGAGVVARRVHHEEVAVGDHAEDHLVLVVDVAAEGARESDAVDASAPEAVHEQRDAGA